MEGQDGKIKYYVQILRKCARVYCFHINMFLLTCFAHMRVGGTGWQDQMRLIFTLFISICFFWLFHTHEGWRDRMPISNTSTNTTFIRLFHLHVSFDMFRTPQIPRKLRPRSNTA